MAVNEEKFSEYVQMYMQMTADVLNGIAAASATEFVETSFQWMDLIRSDCENLGLDGMALRINAAIVLVYQDKFESCTREISDIGLLRAHKNWVRALRSAYPSVFDWLWEAVKDRLIELTASSIQSRRQALEIIHQRIDEEYQLTGRLSKSYGEYLRTPEWKLRRQQKLEQANYRCQKCGKTQGLEVHHLNYERIGFEWDADLIVLCEKHHDQAHGRLTA